MNKVQEIFKAITDKYSDEEVTEMFDEEISNWTPIDGYDEDDYESDYEWYCDHNNGEAEDAIYENFKVEFGFQNLTVEEEKELIDELDSEYGVSFYKLNQ